MLVLAAWALFVSAPAQAAEDGTRNAPLPLTTRYARTASTVIFESGVRYFDGTELQEADHFDGYTVDLMLTVPFMERFQLRLHYPAYTEGEARLTEIGNPLRGQSIDIDGNGGVFDFPNAIIDYEFLHGENAQNWSLAAFAGFGGVLDRLDTSAGDVYNHQGRVVLFGLKADRELSDAMTTAVNLGGRYYYKSDDIHPEHDSDVFGFMDSSVALTYRRPHWLVVPALEFVYQGDLASYHNIHLDPQFTLPVNRHLDVQAGAGIGLTGDGERWRAGLKTVFRF